MNNENKCKTCIGLLNYKTGASCRYCKWNTTLYCGRDESKMINDNYHYVDITDYDDTIPY